MKKITAGTIYIIAGIILAFVSIMYFVESRTVFGFCYICLAITSITLGYRMNVNNKK